MEEQILVGDRPVKDRLKRTTSQENFPPDWQSGNFYEGRKTKENTVVFLVK